MPPKKAASSTTTTAKKTPSHPAYKDMIKDAIINLKERNGSSRQALKKYIHANYRTKEAKNFDSLFNAAIRRGVEHEDFVQPKGPSGPVKLKKKETASKPKTSTAKAPAKKAAATKKAATTKAATTKAATTKTATTKASPKKAASTTKKTATTTKAAPKKATTATTKKATTTKAAPKKAAAKKSAK